MNIPKYLTKAIVPCVLFLSILCSCILTVQTNDMSIEITASSRVTNYCQQAITPDVYLVKVLVTNILELVSLSDIKAA